MTTKKHDGYCAWHPEKGKIVWTLMPTEEDCWLVLVEEGACPVDWEFSGDDFEEQIVDAKKQGWQIKPVCLVTPERLEELEGVGDKAYDWFCNNMAETLNSELWNDFKKEVLGDD